MNRHTVLLSIAICAFALFACAPSGSSQSGEIPITTPLEAVQDAPSALEQIEAAKTPDELRALIETYQTNGDTNSVYLAAKKLIELDPSDTQAYEAAIAALLGGISDDYEEIEALVQQCVENAPADAADFTHWATAQNQTFAFDVPFAADYKSEDEINTLGITPGNLMNADGLFSDFWRNGLFTTQGDWIYLMLPTEDYYVYKMRLDGTGLTPVGDARGDNLNVIGDWLYYKNLNDADMPYRIRTDGTQKEGPLFNRAERLAVTQDSYFYKDGALFRSNYDMSETIALLDGCESMSYYDGWIYYCTGGERSEFCRVSANGGEPEKLLDGWMYQYDIKNGWLYYLINSDQTAIQRMRPDGSEQSVVYQSDVMINSFGLAESKLAVSLCHGQDERGKPYPTDLLVIDLETGAVTQKLKTYSTSIYTAKDHAFFFDEDFVWHSLDLLTGETGVIYIHPVEAAPASQSQQEQQSGIVGNSAANLFMQMDELTKGQVAGQDGRIYFGNPFDDVRLYAATQDGDSLRQLLGDSVSFLNLVDNTLYFCNKNSDWWIQSIGTDGQNHKTILKEHCESLSYADGWLYFSTAKGIFKIPADGGEPVELVLGAFRNVYAKDGWVYYIEDYEIGGLWRVPADGGDPQPLQTDCPAKFYTIDEDMLYLIVDAGDSVDVVSMHLDGSDQQTVFSIHEKLHAVNVCNRRLLIVSDSGFESTYMIVVLNPEDYSVENKIEGLLFPGAYCFDSDVYYIAGDGLVRVNLDTGERVVIAR